MMIATCKQDARCRRSPRCSSVALPQPKSAICLRSCVTDAALVAVGWYTPYHGDCTTPDGSLVRGDVVPSLYACRALPAVWSTSEDGSSCSDGISSNATGCQEAFRAPPSGWTNGLNWETPLWCDVVVFVAPVACTISPSFQLSFAQSSLVLAWLHEIHCACFDGLMQMERATCSTVGSGATSRSRLASLSKALCRARYSRSHYLRPRLRASFLTSASPFSSPTLLSKQLGRSSLGGSFSCRFYALRWQNATQNMPSPRRQCQRMTACSTSFGLCNDMPSRPPRLQVDWSRSFFTASHAVHSVANNSFSLTSRISCPVQLIYMCSRSSHMCS